MNKLLKAHRMAEIPEESEIIMGHLIPEYDMITSTWQKVSQFTQTIAPTWKQLYLDEWAEVEEMIRELSFSVSIFFKHWSEIQCSRFQLLYRMKFVLWLIA